MKRIVITVLMCLLIVQNVQAEELQKMKLTCYCPESCPGEITASGARVREGIVASNREHLGDCAMIYLEDGTFLGYYECLDTGKGKIQPNGKGAIEMGYVLDMWRPDLDSCTEMMKLTGGNILVKFIENPKG